MRSVSVKLLILFVPLIAAQFLCAIQNSQASDDLSFTVTTSAQVEVSGGLKFSAKTSYEHPGKATFHRKYPDQVITLRMDDEDFWRDDGDGEAPMEGNESNKEFILGHQIHAWLLHFNALAGGKSSCQDVDIFDKTTRGIHVEHEQFSKTLIPCEGRPVYLYMQFGNTRVQISFTDWREIQGVELPFVVSFNDGTRTFLYHYDEIVITE
jgi:hypothetical protein